LALKKISSIRQISGLLKPVEGKFIQVQKDVGNGNGFSLLQRVTDTDVEAT
jgi:hypothetical protein